MNLESDKRLNIQLRLDFSSVPTGEARQAGREDIESLSVVNEPERPANTSRIMDEICERANLKEALRRVRDNKGSAGVDRVTVDQLGDYLKQHWPVIREQLLNGTYKPKPVKRVEIPKPDGGVRKLGIPTVLDRFIQQVVMQVLQRQWDPTFSDHSYGFRPGRSAHQAVAQAQRYIAVRCPPSRSADAPETPAPTTEPHAPSPPETAPADSSDRTSQTHPDSPDSAASSTSPRNHKINQSGRGCRTCAEIP